MADAPPAAVVVPVRDDAAGLRRCLLALAAQTVAPQEVVVVDDGSRVDLGPLVAAHRGVRLLRAGQVSSYAARNAGVAATRAPVVAFTDADCVPQPDWLHLALQRLRDPTVGVVAGAVRVQARSPARPGLVERYDARTAFPQEAFVRRWGFGVTANLVVRREVLQQVGGFEARLVSGGDAEWGQRATAAGVVTVFAPEVVVAHPARRTLHQLGAKALRLERGIAGLGVLRGGLEPVHVLVGERLAAPWRAAPALLRDQALGRLHHRLGVAAVSAAVGGMAAHAVLRARLVGPVLAPATDLGVTRGCTSPRRS